jgi:hypothetical protein
MPATTRHLRLMVEQILQSIDWHAVLCPMRNITVRASELVARGKQPVAVVRTRNPGCVHPGSLYIRKTLQALALEPALAAERYVK